MKVIGSILIILLCIAVQYHMAERSRKICYYGGGDSIVKRIGSVFIVLLCMAELCNVPVSLRTAPAAAETVKTSLSKITIEPKGREYIMDFVSSGTDYSVKVTDTMEAYQKGDQEYSIFEVSLHDKNNNIIQQFTCDIVRRHILELKCDDLNFDGFSDLEIGYSNWRNKTNYCYVFLWDAGQEKFKSKAIRIPLEYEIHKDKKALTTVSYYSGMKERTICRINEKDELEELRYWITDNEKHTEVIGERGEGKIIYEEDTEDLPAYSYMWEEDYEDIFWSDLPGDCQKLRTFWTMEVDDYKISLQDLIRHKSMKLVLSKDSDEKILQVYQQIWDCGPEDITADTFKNLLGHNGFSICYNPSEYQYYTYYYAIEEGKLKYLADSWGRERDDHMVDIDKDGSRELICNVEYLGDGARDALIYYRNGQEIWYKWGGSFLDEEYDDHGTGSVYSQYLPEKNVVSIYFWNDDLDDYKVKEYEVKLDKTEASPYTKEQSG